MKKQYLSKTHTSLASIFKTVNLILGLPPLNQYDAAATDPRDICTGTPDFTPYTFQNVQYAGGASATWLALSREVDFSRPDLDETRLVAAIMKSEGSRGRSRQRRGNPACLTEPGLYPSA